MLANKNKNEIFPLLLLSLSFICLSLILLILVLCYELRSMYYFAQRNTYIFILWLLCVILATTLYLPLVRCVHRRAMQSWRTRQLEAWTNWRKKELKKNVYNIQRNRIAELKIQFILAIFPPKKSLSLVLFFYLYTIFIVSSLFSLFFGEMKREIIIETRSNRYEKVVATTRKKSTIIIFINSLKKEQKEENWWKFWRYW